MNSTKMNVLVSAIQKLVLIALQHYGTPELTAASPEIGNNPSPTCAASKLHSFESMND